MKTRMSRNSSEKERRPTRRGKRDHRKHFFADKTDYGNDLGRRDQLPKPKTETEAQLGLEEEPSSIPNMMQSGGLQGTAGTKALTSESIAELFEEGQDLETELVLSVGNTPDVDQSKIRTHQASREEAPEYRNRNRI